MPTSHPDNPTPVKASSRRQFSTFFLHDLYLGVEVLKVQELIDRKSTRLNSSH